MCVAHVVHAEQRLPSTMQFIFIQIEWVQPKSHAHRESAETHEYRIWMHHTFLILNHHSLETSWIFDYFDLSRRPFCSSVLRLSQRFIFSLARSLSLHYHLQIVVFHSRVCADIWLLVSILNLSSKLINTLAKHTQTVERLRLIESDGEVQTIILRLLDQTPQICTNGWKSISHASQSHIYPIYRASLVGELIPTWECMVLDNGRREPGMLR